MMWHLMRQAALARHWLMVMAWYPPGPARDRAWRRHMAVVRLFYGY